MTSTNSSTVLAPAATARARRSQSFPWETILVIVVLSLGALMIIAPFLWVLQTSLTDSAVAYRLPPQLIPESLTIQNYLNVFELVPFAMFVRNSLFISASITLGQLITCSMGAYAFARLKFPGRDILFIVLLATLMIPLQVTIVPLFILMRELGLYNSHWSVIFPAIISPFGIFLLRQYYMTIPQEYEDAARVDGANYFTIFVRIMLPLSWPALTTLGIVCFVYWWNEFFIPLIMINSPELQVLPVGITLLQGRYSAGAVGNVSAGITMAVVPVLIIFLLLQRNIIKSIASTGIKG